MKRAIAASAGGGIMAGMLIIGSGNARAEVMNSSVINRNATISGMNHMHRWNSQAKINSLVNSLGLDSDKIKNELKEGKNLKQILQDNGIVPEHLEKAFNTGKKSQSKRHFKKLGSSASQNWQ